jgi:hypothetical protein
VPDWIENPGGEFPKLNSMRADGIQKETGFAMAELCSEAGKQGRCIPIPDIRLVNPWVDEAENILFMTETMVSVVEKIFSVTGTMVFAAEKIFSITLTMVFMTEKIFLIMGKIFSIA